MIKPITVIESEAPLVAAPAAEVTIDMVDIGFGVSGTISSGTQYAQAPNKGQQEHEAFLIQLNPGASVEEFLGAFEPGAPPGPPPGQGLGGFQEVKSGGGGVFTTDFRAGQLRVGLFRGRTQHRRASFCPGNDSRIHCSVTQSHSAV